MARGILSEGAVPAVLKVTAKGQITLRKEVLRHLGVRPGDKLAVDLLPEGRAGLHAAKPTGSLDNFIGCLQRPGTKPLSIEEISAIAAEGWAGRR
jgi:bifunctional DNA-binding transcriptional regulator/antitoxin component of YhaV-PrlF toxin-antitoxin module